MKNALSIFEFGRDALARGERIALVTITAVIGRSAREPGSHMMVSSSGSYWGSFSGGCVEAAVVGEALRVLEKGETETLRLGLGSPYMDIRLPCGGGIDLLFHPDPDSDLVGWCASALADRLAVQLVLDPLGPVRVGRGQGGIAGWSGGLFHAVHEPDLQLLILGHGAEPFALARLALAYGAPVTVLTPDEELAVHLRAIGVAAHLLKTPSRSAELSADAWTAIVALFHDHDWETDLLAQALETDACFIGAMGSRETHKNRVAALLAKGVLPSDADQIVGPIGLIPATRDPDTLALSVISQIVAERDLRRKADAEEIGRRQADGGHPNFVLG